MLAGICFRSSEDDTVNNDKRDVYAESRIKCGHIGLHKELYQCNKRSYNNDKTGDNTGWRLLNGEANMTTDSSEYVSLQSKIRTGPNGTGNGGSGLFGAGGAGGNGGIFNRYTQGGAGGPATVRMVFSPINSNDW